MLARFSMICYDIPARERRVEAQAQAAGLIQTSLPLTRYQASPMPEAFKRLL